MFGRSNPDDPPYRAPYPYKEIWRKHRGVGGEIGWPDIGSPTPQLVNGLASIDSFVSCRKYWEVAKKKYPRARINMIAVGEVEDNNDVHFFFLGYDCGIMDEHDNYSAIQNDLLFRTFQELEPFQRLLNKNLLFSSPIDAEAFLVKRRELLKQGYDLETDDNEFYSIPIYSIAPNRRK